MRLAEKLQAPSVRANAQQMRSHWRSRQRRHCHVEIAVLPLLQQKGHRDARCGAAHRLQLHHHDGTKSSEQLDPGQRTATGERTVHH